MTNRKYYIEYIIFFTYALFAISWVSGSMMTKEIMTSYQIEGVANATWTTNAITLAKILGNLLAAWVLVKMGIKKAFIFASILIVIGGVGVFAHTYSMYVFSRLVMGIGGALVIVYFNPIVVHYFTDKERPLINGINAASFNTGNLVALLLTGSLLSYLETWQNVILAISIVSFIILVIACFVIQDFSLTSTNSNAKANDNYSFKMGLKDPVNWYLPFTYSGLLFCYISIFALFPLVPNFSVDPSKLSAILISMGMVGTVLGIIITKKLPKRIPIIRWSGFVMTVAAAIMIFTTNSFIAYSMACIAGLFMFLPMTALITLAQELPNMTTKRITVIFGMFWSISYAISTILMYIAGIIADSTGSIIIAVIFAVVCSATFFIGSFLLPETGKK